MAGVLDGMGFSKNEILVYKALLKIGPTTAGPIARESGVHRSKVYDSLTRLINRGVVAYHKQGARAYFQAQDPKILLEIHDEERDKLQQEIQEMSKIKHDTSKEEVTVLEGYNGIGNFYKDIVTTLPEGETVKIFGARAGQDSSPKTWTAFFSNINKQRIRRHINYQIIYDKELKNKQIVKEHATSELTQTRFLDIKTISDVSIHGDSIAVVLWKKTPKAFIIKSKDVADSFRQYFEVLWKSAEK